MGWHSNARGAQALEIQDGAAISRSPWWIDYNHAPPGGGYLHLLFFLPTAARGNASAYRSLAGPNRFLEAGFPRDFRGAEIALRVRGELEARGAQMVLLAQAKTGGVYVNQVLIGQPIRVGPSWSEQSLRLEPDEEQWTCLGARHDRGDFYGAGPVEQVLADLNDNIILVLYPLDVQPAEPVRGDPHRLRAGEDYRVDETRLPRGYVMLDWIEIRLGE
jgi:hypothetical protein